MKRKAVIGMKKQKSKLNLKRVCVLMLVMALLCSTSLPAYATTGTTAGAETSEAGDASNSDSSSAATGDSSSDTNSDTNSDSSSTSTSDSSSASSSDSSSASSSASSSDSSSDSSSVSSSASSSVSSSSSSESSAQNTEEDDTTVSVVFYDTQGAAIGSPVQVESGSAITAFPGGYDAASGWLVVNENDERVPFDINTLITKDMALYLPQEFTVTFSYQDFPADAARVGLTLADLEDKLVEVIVQEGETILAQQIPQSDRVDFWLDGETDTPYAEEALLALSIQEDLNLTGMEMASTMMLGNTGTSSFVTDDDGISGTGTWDDPLLLPIGTTVTLNQYVGFTDADVPNTHYWGGKEDITLWGTSWDARLTGQSEYEGVDVGTPILNEETAMTSVSATGAAEGFDRVRVQWDDPNHEDVPHDQITNTGYYTNAPTIYQSDYEYENYFYFIVYDPNGAVAPTHDYDPSDMAQPGEVTFDKDAEWTDYEEREAEIVFDISGVPTGGNTDVIIIMDKSTSLGTNGLNTAKTAATSLTNALLEEGNNNRVAYIPFSGNTSGSINFQTDANAVINNISSTTSYKGPYGASPNAIGTNYTIALQQAELYASLRTSTQSERPLYILIITDGLPDSRDYLFEEGGPGPDINNSYINGLAQVTSLIENYNAEIQPIAVGSLNAYNLSKLASEGKTPMSASLDGTALDELLSSISADMSLAGTNAILTDVISEYFEVDTDALEADLTASPRQYPYYKGAFELETVGTGDDAREVVTITVGDITSTGTQIVIPVRLKDEYHLTNREDYPTNEEAIIEYDPPEGEREEKDAPPPELGVGVGKIDIHYVWVNSAGHPLNEAGKVIADGTQVDGHIVQESLFEDNGSTALEINPTTGTSYDVYANEVPGGYRLYTESHATVATSITLTHGNQNQTVYYPVVIDYVVTYEPNDGREGTDAAQAPVINEHSHGETPAVENNTFTAPEGDSDTIYIFKEWNTEKDGSGTTYAPGTNLPELEGPVTLYAQWDEVSLRATGVTEAYNRTEYDMVSNYGLTRNGEEGTDVTPDATYSFSTTEPQAGSEFPENDTFSQEMPTMFNVADSGPVWVKATFVINDETVELIVKVDSAVTPIPLRLVVDSYEKVEGANDPAFELESMEGLLEGDTLAYDLEREAGEVARTTPYEIDAILTPDDITNGNYEITVVPGGLTITLQDTTVVPGPDTEPDTTPDPDPTPDPTPEVDTAPEITDAGTPPIPDATPAAAAVVPAVPGVAPVVAPVVPAALTLDLADTLIPLATAPQDVEVQIGDTTIPLAAADGSAWSLVDLLLTVATGLMSIFLLVGYFVKKKAKEDEENERFAHANDEEDNTRLKRKGAFRLFSIIPMIGAIVLFILTQDMTQPMILVDEWTIFFAIIALVQTLTMILSRKKNVRDEEDEQPTHA